MSDRIDFDWRDNENPAKAGIVARLAAKPPRERDDGPPVRQAPGLWYVPSDDGAWLGDLTRQFSRGQLIATGWFAPTNGELALHASLRRAGTPALALRKFVRRPPFALLADGAPYGGGSLLGAALQDYDTRELLATCEPALLVTRSIAEVAAWRRLGLPAAPVADLPQQSLHEQRRAAALRTRVRPAEPAEDLKGGVYYHPRTGASFTSVATNSVMLVAPAWDPATFAAQPPDAARAAADALLASQNAAGCDFGGVALWQPDGDRLEAARAAAADPAQFRLLTNRSLAADLVFAEFERSSCGGLPVRERGSDAAGGNTVACRIVEGLRRQSGQADVPLVQLQLRLLADQAEEYFRHAPLMGAAERLAAQKSLHAHIAQIHRCAPRRARRRP